MRRTRAHLLVNSIGVAILCFFFCGSGVASANLVAHYKLDEAEPSDAAGAVLDSAGTQHGTTINGAGVIQGSATAKFGAAYQFTGGAGVNLGAAPAVQPSDDFTISLWLRPDSLNAWSRLIESMSGVSNYGNGIRVDTGAAGNDLRVLIRDGNGVSNTQCAHSLKLTSSTWYFAAIRYDTDAAGNGLRVTLIADTPSVTSGDVTASTESPGSIGTGDITFPHDTGTFLGTVFPDGSSPYTFRGSIDDVAYYDHVLTDDELANAFNYGAEYYATGEPATSVLTLLDEDFSGLTGDAPNNTSSPYPEGTWYMQDDAPGESESQASGVKVLDIGNGPELRVGMPDDEVKVRYRFPQTWQPNHRYTLTGDWRILTALGERSDGFTVSLAEMDANGNWLQSLASTTIDPPAPSAGLTGSFTLTVNADTAAYAGAAQHVAVIIHHPGAPAPARNDEYLVDNIRLEMEYTGKPFGPSSMPYLMAPVDLGIDVGTFSGPAVADWNNDGKQDLIVGRHEGGNVLLYLNQGTASSPAFSSSTLLKAKGVNISSPSIGFCQTLAYSCPQVVDWNSDGKKDLLLGVANCTVRAYINTGTDAAPVFNDGASGYFVVQESGANYDCGEYAHPDVVDWDNDGDLDLLCGDYFGAINLAINSAGPGTTPVLSSSSNLEDSNGEIDCSGHSYPEVFDWTGDGRKDLLVGEKHNANVLLFANSGTDESPVLTSPVKLNAGGSTLSAHAYANPEVCDLNSDDIPDLVVGSVLGNVLYYQGLRPVTVDLPGSATEGDGTVSIQGVVRIASPASSNVVVALECEPAGELTIPSTVTIPALSSSATFDITITDDTDLDGSQPVMISANTYGYSEGSGLIMVHDNESTTLSLSLPDSATEGGATLTGTVSLGGGPSAHDITVSLSSDDTSELTVPATVTVPAGTVSQTFSVTIVDDTVLDGSQSATISAHVENSTDGAATVTVHDNEPTDLVVALPDWTGEGDGLLPDAGTIILSGTVTSALEVALASLDLTELTVPASVTIPAGASSATFDLTVIEDHTADNQQTVTVTATAAGFTAGSSTVPVADSTVHHIEFENVPSPQTANHPFSVTVRMCDALGSNAAFSGSIDLSATGDSGNIAVAPLSAGPFARGTWTGSVQVNAVDSNVRLKGAFADKSVWSNPFDLVPGSLDHFTFAPIASPQTVSLPFGVEISARDINGYLATGFEGTANMEISSEFDVGTGTESWNYPFARENKQARTQFIVPASELSGAGTITALALEVLNKQWGTVSLLTIRLKHTDKTSYTTAEWESAGSGWSTVYWRSYNPNNTTGWTTFELSPYDYFEYNGTDNLMVDMSFDNPVTYSAITTRCTTATAPRTLYSGGNTGVNPTRWEGTSPAPSTSHKVPNIRFSMVPPAMTPETTGAFVDGVWAGNVALLGGRPNLRIRATSGAGDGISGFFDVVDPTVHLGSTIQGHADDAREMVVSNVVTIADNTLDLGAGDQLVTAVRFADLAIPAGATIRAASVQFTAADTNSADVAVTVYGEKTPDAAAFVEGLAGNLTGRARTTNSLAWNPDPWEQIDDAGPAQETPDLTAILQEIVSQPGWASNQAVNLMFFHDSSAGVRTAHAFDSDPAKGPVLRVSYLGPDLDLDGIPDDWEIQHFGTTTVAGGLDTDDFDGDGMCDRHEYLCGTDPTSSSSVLAFTHCLPESGGGLILRWASAAGRTYAIDEASDLRAGFYPFVSGLPATPPENAYTVTVEQAEAPVFYRIRLE